MAMGATGTASSRRGGGNLPSRLPSPTSKSKGRTRRRGRVVLLKQIRLVALFFLAVIAIAIFKVGLPHAANAPAWNTSMIGFNLSESQADIKMNNLYETIEFKDIDGGAWKQGWNVQYKGDEWDKRKLKVFVVPHSHNDPGWLKTVEQYYQEQSRRILSTIVQALLKDKKRKFIWEEMSYLERWWRDASESEKKNFIELVKSGQLEIVGGGWVMNDEANSHYFAIIEQMTEGNLWLHETVGVIPKNAWAIDPFGHSPTMAYLLRRMGFKNMLIQRTHYEVKKALAQEQNLEFFWRQSWDRDNTTDILCHMMPFYSYDIPHTCGPEPAICCQFDYWRLPGYGSAQRCPWGYNPQLISEDNVKERSEKLLDQYRKKSTLYRTNTLLVPLGDDFRYITVGEADLQFENYQKIFDYINAHPDLKAEVQFGTLQDYFTSLRYEADAAAKEEKRVSLNFPTLSGDFFTYADRVQDYWSGYYVSRPFYKALDRVLEETVRAADILFSLSVAYCKESHHGAFPLPFKEKLVAARRTLALFQHHDGVTGTAKNHVVSDYAKRMQVALLDLQRFMAESLGALLSEGIMQGICNKDTHLHMLEPEQSRISHDMLPVRNVVNLVADQVRRVVIYNPLEEAVKQIVVASVESAEVCVIDSEGVAVDSQASPEWHKSKDIVHDTHRLHWLAQLPPLGVKTFFISGIGKSPSCTAAEVAQLKVFNAPQAFICPPPYKCSHPEGEVIEIQNQHQRLVFSANDGLLLSANNYKDGIEMAIKEDIGLYSSWGSGAYLFKPVGEAQSIVHSGGFAVVTEGPIMQEVYTQPKSNWDPSPVSRAARLYNGQESVQAFMVEMDYHVELLDHVYNDKELIVRYRTDLETGNTFFSDLNGFQTIARETRAKIPLQGNYYPMPSLAFLQGPEGRRFSIHCRQALGVASSESGWLEVMLDRRLTRDDDRGLGQGVLDNRPIDVVFHLLLESNASSLPEVSATTPRVPSLLSHRVSAQLNYPMHKFFGTMENMSSALSSQMLKDFAPLAARFPCDLHMVNFKALLPSPTFHHVEKPLFAISLQRRGWDPYFCQKGRTQCTRMADNKMSLSSLFTDLNVRSAVLSSLNLLHDDRTDQIPRVESFSRKKLGDAPAEQLGMISLSPMEVQSFKLLLTRDNDKLLQKM